MRRKSKNPQKQSSKASKRGRRFFSYTFFLLFIFGIGCAVWMHTQNVIPGYTGTETEWNNQWRPIFKGVEYTEGHLMNPRELRVHAVRINLKSPSIKLCITQSNGDQEGEVNSLTTSGFIEKYGCQIAVNGSMFEPARKRSGMPMNVLGWSVSDGDEYSAPANNLHSIAFTKNKDVHYGMPIPDSPESITHAIGGLWMVLRDGEITNDQEKDPNPRTIIGTSKDREFLFLIVIDGRQPGYSEGVNPDEAGILIKSLGVWDALNLDGGGSTTMALQNKYRMGVVINRPSSPYIPGIQRPVANHFGIYAPRL